MNRLLVTVFLVLLVFVPAICEAQANNGGAKGMDFQISSTAFSAGSTIPQKFTCDGEDVSPVLAWNGAPPNTKAFALIVDDPDAPAGTWNHWLVWNIPASMHEFVEGASKSDAIGEHAHEGTNDFRKSGYNGPCPPPGKPHRYYFKLFAIDTPLSLQAGATRDELDSAMKSHVIAQAELMGRYGR